MNDARSVNQIRQMLQAKWQFQELKEVKSFAERDYRLAQIEQHDKLIWEFKADRFEWNGLKIEVMDMDRNRVNTLLIVQTMPGESA